MLVESKVLKGVTETFCKIPGLRWIFSVKSVINLTLLFTSSALERGKRA